MAKPGHPSALRLFAQPWGYDCCCRRDNDGQFTLRYGSQPTYKLRPYQSRTFVIDELEGFRVEFHLGLDQEVMN